MWGFWFVELLAPRPRQHGMLHSKLRLTAQEKAIEKENTATHFQAQHLFSASKLYQHCAKRTMGVALPLPGRGGGISPHMKALLHCFLKSSPQDLMPLRVSFGMQHPMLPRAWGEQPHKAKTPYESILASFSKRNRLCFIKQLPLGFMPVRASFGIKRPAFTWGSGGGASPRRCVRKSRFWAT